MKPRIFLPLRARYDQYIETVDLLPSLFEFIGLPEPREFQGRSFAPLIADTGRAYEAHAQSSVRTSSPK